MEGVPSGRLDYLPRVIEDSPTRLAPSCGGPRRRVGRRQVSVRTLAGSAGSPSHDDRDARVGSHAKLPMGGA
jgi:hypothetical protein